jgi:uracil-DNA glycosylase
VTVIVGEYAIDTAILAEERNILEHIATLTGKWRRKIEHAGADAGPILISVAPVLRSRRAERLAKEEVAADATN